jgi:hypothetical protein
MEVRGNRLTVNLQPGGSGWTYEASRVEGHDRSDSD